MSFCHNQFNKVNNYLIWIKIGIYNFFKLKLINLFKSLLVFKLVMNLANKYLDLNDSDIDNIYGFKCRIWKWKWK